MTALKDYTTHNGVAWLSEDDHTRLARLRRGLMKYDRSPVRRKLPITLHRLLEMLKHAPLTDLRNLQYVPMAFLAHDGLLRYSELHNLTCGDLAFTSGDTVELTIRISKTTHDKPPEVITLDSYMIHGTSFCAVSLLRSYYDRLKAAHYDWGRSDHPLFPDIRTGRLFVRPTPKTHFVAWTQARLAQAGHDASKYSGHSFRSGGATDLYGAGAHSRTIKIAGRWSSEAYVIYIRDHPEEAARNIAKAYQYVITYGRDIGRTK